MPLICMIWLDGVDYRKFGVPGLLSTDAGANLLVSAAAVAVFLARELGLRKNFH